LNCFVFLPGAGRSSSTRTASGRIDTDWSTDAYLSGNPFLTEDA